MPKKSLSVDDSSQTTGPGPQDHWISPDPLDTQLDAATDKRVLLMMAKYWHPGQVKTRLAATIGDRAAAELHHVFVRQLSTSLSTCGDWRQILAAPDDCCEVFASEVTPAWKVFPQGAGDLRQRMWRAFRRMLSTADRCSAAVMIGADLPTLTAAEIERAFAALDDNDLVLGPARDGGYYLIGLRGRLCGADAAAPGRFEFLFQDIAWGSSTVLAQTRRHAEEGELKVALLEQRQDIDTQAELHRLIRRLATPHSAAEIVLGKRINRVLRRHRLASLFPAETRTN